MVCTGEGTGDFARLQGLLPLARVVLRNGAREVCAWQPDSGTTYFDSCEGTGSGPLIRVPVALADGWVLESFIEPKCLFRAVVPTTDTPNVRYDLAVRRLGRAAGAEGAYTFAGGRHGMEAWLPWAGMLAVTEASAVWPVVMVISAPQMSVLREWSATLPLQLSLISGLALALWFGPMALVRRRFSIEGQVAAALRRGDFFLAYLPTVELTSMDWTGAEALLRWRHSRHGVLMPGAFIPWIEQSPLIYDTTRWVMIQAAQDLTRMSQLKPEFLLAINLPPQQLGDLRLIDVASEAFGAEPLALCQVIFELTERQMGNYAAPDVREVVRTLRQRGAQFALDDFGVGFSNLSLLQQIEVDYLKIDRSFLQARGQQWDGPDVLEAVIHLARTLGMMVIVEGVETERDLERVRRFGIRFAQGFLFSRPVEVEVLLKHLSTGEPALQAT